jgi:hypothetical protein
VGKSVSGGSRWKQTGLASGWKVVLLVAECKGGLIRSAMEKKTLKWTARGESEGDGSALLLVLARWRLVRGASSGEGARGVLGG